MLLSQLQQVTRKMCLLLRRRSRSSPLSCHSWIPSIYNQPLRDPGPQVPTGSDGSWEVSLQPLWRLKPLMASGEENGLPCSSDALLPLSTSLCSQPLGPGWPLPSSFPPSLSGTQLPELKFQAALSPPRVRTPGLLCSRCQAQPLCFLYLVCVGHRSLAWSLTLCLPWGQWSQFLLVARGHQDVRWPSSSYQLCPGLLASTTTPPALP